MQSKKAGKNNTFRDSRLCQVTKNGTMPRNLFDNQRSMLLRTNGTIIPRNDGILSPVSGKPPVPYFCIITSKKMTASQALIQYKVLLTSQHVQ